MNRNRNEKREMKRDTQYRKGERTNRCFMHLQSRLIKGGANPRHGQGVGRTKGYDPDKGEGNLEEW